MARRAPPPALLREFGDQLRDAPSTLFVLQILVNSLGEAHPKTAAALSHLARLTDDAGDAKSMLRGFETISGGGDRRHPIKEEELSTVIDYRLAHARLLLHHDARGKAERVLDGIAASASGRRGVPPPEVLGLKGMCMIKTDPAAAMKAWHEGIDRGDETSEVNVAAATRDADKRREAFTALLAKYPHNLAVLNGAGQYNRVLEMEREWEEKASATTTTTRSGNDDASELRARFAQALVNVAIGASAERFSVTSEGLFRSAEKHLLAVRRAKPVYALELGRCYAGYAQLLSSWENRQGEAEQLKRKSQDIVNGTEAITAMPSFDYYLRGWKFGEG